MCLKAVKLVRDVRYCGRCHLAGVAVDGKNDDPLPSSTAAKLKKAEEDFEKELQAAGHPAPVMPELRNVPNAPQPEPAPVSNKAKH